MTLYQNDLVKVFFGNKETALDPALIRGEKSEQVLNKVPFLKIHQALGADIKRYVFQHQTHGIKGAVISEETGNAPFFIQEGDYLITALPEVGIGVATADCLPLILVDSVCKAVGVVHAGWKGLVAGVVEEAIACMGSTFGSKISNLSVIVGPSAQNCCYEVGKDFFDQASALRPEITQYLKRSLTERQGAIFFDNRGFLKDVFFEKGLSEGGFDFSCAECTICTPVYCSYRREKMSPLRQLTIVSLK